MHTLTCVNAGVISGLVARHVSYCAAKMFRENIGSNTLSNYQLKLIENNNFIQI